MYHIKTKFVSDVWAKWCTATNTYGWNSDRWFRTKLAEHDDTVALFALLWVEEPIWTFQKRVSESMDERYLSNKCAVKMVGSSKSSCPSKNQVFHQMPIKRGGLAYGSQNDLESTIEPWLDPRSIGLPWLDSSCCCLQWCWTSRTYIYELLEDIQALPDVSLSLSSSLSCRLLLHYLVGWYHLYITRLFCCVLSFVPMIINRSHSIRYRERETPGTIGQASHWRHFSLSLSTHRLSRTHVYAHHSSTNSDIYRCKPRFQTTATHWTDITVSLLVAPWFRSNAFQGEKTTVSKPR